MKLREGKKLKSYQIEEVLYERLKEYCNKHNLKITLVISELIEEEVLKLLNGNKNKKIKVD